MSRSVLKGISSDSFLLTEYGYKAVCDIQPGDIVIAADGSGHEIIMVSDEGEGNACRVSASSCIDYAVSPDTLLMVRDLCRMKDRENDRTRQFLSVSDLQEKDAFKSYLAGLPVEKKSTIPSWEGIDVFRGDIFIRKNTLRLDDPDFWYIVGVYIKRGYLPSNPRNTDLSSPYYKL